MVLGSNAVPKEMLMFCVSVLPLVIARPAPRLLVHGSTGGGASWPNAETATAIARNTAVALHMVTPLCGSYRAPGKSRTLDLGPWTLDLERSLTLPRFDIRHSTSTSFRILNVERRVSSVETCEEREGPRAKAPKSKGQVQGPRPKNGRRREGRRPGETHCLAGIVVGSLVFMSMRAPMVRTFLPLRTVTVAKPQSRSGLIARFANGSTS